MPSPLVEATKDWRANRIGYELWQQRLEARNAYALRQKAKPDSEGNARLMCPAAGVAPTVTCPHKPATTSRHMLGKTPIILTQDTKENPPKVCTQQTVSFPVAAGERFQQALPHRSRAWAKGYGVLRNAIEGLNRIIKDGTYEAIADATKRRVRGTAASSVMVAFGLFAVNLRKIDTFMALAETGDDGALRKPRKKRARAKTPATDLPTGSIDPHPTG